MSSTRLAKAKQRAAKTGRPVNLEHDWSPKPPLWGVSKKERKKLMEAANAD